MKDFFTELFMWWVDWLVDGEAYVMIWRFVATFLFIGFLGFAIWSAIWGKNFSF